MNHPIVFPGMFNGMKLVTAPFSELPENMNFGLQSIEWHKSKSYSFIVNDKENILPFFEGK